MVGSVIAILVLLAIGVGFMLLFRRATVAQEESGETTNVQVFRTISIVGFALAALVLIFTIFLVINGVEF